MLCIVKVFDVFVGGSGYKSSCATEREARKVERKKPKDTGGNLKCNGRLVIPHCLADACRPLMVTTDSTLRQSHQGLAHRVHQQVDPVAVTRPASIPSIVLYDTASITRGATQRRRTLQPSELPSRTTPQYISRWRRLCEV